MSEYCQLVVFSNKAYNAIIRESFDKHPVETGGILLGHVLSNGVWIVMEVLPPGINSIFEYAYFEYDEKFVNYLAQSVANQYKQPLDVLGLWHRHPGSMDVFSSTDDSTNEIFARQNKAGVISGLVNIDPKFRLTMYHLDHNKGKVFGRPDYEVVDIEVGDDIIPEEFFELRYFGNGKDDLHPGIAMKQYDREVYRDLNHENPSVSASIADETAEAIDQTTPAPQTSTEQRRSATPKFVDDFFYFWKFSPRRGKYLLWILCAVVIGVFVFKQFTKPEIVEQSNPKVPDKETPKNDGKKESDTPLNSKYEDEQPGITKGSPLKNPALYNFMDYDYDEKNITLRIGESEPISNPSSDGKKIIWKSADKSIADVKDGEINAYKDGETVIYGYLDNDIIVEYFVSVLSSDSVDEGSLIDSASDNRSDIPSKAEVDVSKTYKKKKEGSIKVGDTFKIPVTKPDNVTVTFESTKPDVATVDGNGNVKGLKEGNSEINILSDGKISDTYKITITK